MKKTLLPLIALFSLKAHSIEYHANEIANAFQIPWAIEFIDKHTAIVNEKKGIIHLLNTNTGKKKPIFLVPNIYNNGQGGLLDVALAPNADPNKPSLYFSYSKKTPKGATLALAKARLENDKLIDWNDIFIADADSTTARHFGSRIAFIDDKLFLTIGDRGVRKNGQNTLNHAATLLRLNLDGSIPVDNPFVGTNSKPEIWSYGHRNAQGLFYDKQSKHLWSIEHGERGGDEINLIEKGKNYGWAKVAYGKEYWGPFNVASKQSAKSVAEPKLVYIPSIAPSNLILYRGKQYPQLNGKLLAGALKLTHINVVSIDHGKLTEHSRLFEKHNERVRDITISPDEFIYFSTDSGKIFRVEQK